MSGKVFRKQIQVRFEHCDSAGIMFYPHYFFFINRVMEDWFAEALGCDWKEYHFDRRLGIPTAHFDVAFTAPSRLNDVLDWELRVTGLGTKSVTVEHRASCAGEDRVRVAQRLVAAALDGIKAVPIPDDIRGRMEAFLA